MAISQQKFREIVFQLLYSYDFAGEEEELIALIMHQLAVTKKTVRSAQERVQQIIEKREEIDHLIEKMAVSYEFDRIPRVERNVLRLGVFELLHDPSIPPKVALAEAIRISRKFATAESSSFINAVLDSVHRTTLASSS